jgi:UDP-N-acetylmuramate dehydrogenase
LGGPARFFAEPSTDEDLIAAVEFAETRGLPVLILGSGSNLLVGDAGFPGLVLHLSHQEKIVGENGRFTIPAGSLCDSVVAHFVENGWTGVECLSGIPGTMGAAPVQNIGAYGQEIADTLVEVRVFDRQTHRFRHLSQDECRFTYRQSLFKIEPDRYVILEVTLNLRRTTPSSPRNEELAQTLTTHADLKQIREAVLAIRRKKGMVYDPSHPCHRSAGSFFTNPVVSSSTADAIAACALAHGQIRNSNEMPRYPQPDGHWKIPAAWLIEKAGIPKGFRQGPVGISPHHALALVHYGGGSTAQLLQLARYVQALVFNRFQVELIPEPVFIGIDEKK